MLEHLGTDPSVSSWLHYLCQTIESLCKWIYLGKIQLGFKVKLSWMEFI